MWKVCTIVLTILLFVTPVHVASAAIGASEPVAYPIDSSRYLDPQQFAFLADTLRDIEVVGLGESIHMTHEFPLVRTGMVRFLNESMGFRVLALEGSAVDLWATQDRLLASRRTEMDISQAQRGLFGIWNTPEMRKLFDYEVKSWKSSTPLYITAYDIQPGSGSGTRGTEAFRLFAERLRNYANPPAKFDLDEWLAQMAPLTSACRGYSQERDETIENGITSLTTWIAAAAPQVQKQYADLPHAAVLRLVPDNLKASLQLCQDLHSGDRTAPGYKPTRDRNAAQYALQLKDAAPNQKLILWAHISHIFYDSTGRSTSVGEILRSKLGPRMYSLGVFGEAGGTILFISDVNDSMAYLPVHGIFGALRSKVNGLCPEDCFLDLRGTDDALFTTPHAVFIEAYPQPMALAHDFDGVVWIKKVHAPDIPRGALLVMGTTAYWRPPFVYVLAPFVMFCAVLLIVMVYRKRRLRLSSPNS